MSDTVTISASEYKKMQRDVAKLDALEAGGVDNWDFYGESLSEWFKENALDDLFEQAYEELHERLAEAEVEEPAGRGCGYSIRLNADSCTNLFKWFIMEYKKLEDDDE